MGREMKRVLPKMNISKQLGKVLSERRKQLDMSQAEMAQESGMSVDWLSRVERGVAQNVSKGAVVSLLIALGVPPHLSQLVTQEDGRYDNSRWAFLPDGSMCYEGRELFVREGGTSLQGAKVNLERQEVVFPNGVLLRPDTGVSMAVPERVGPDGECPSGSLMFSDGTIRTPDEPRVDGVTWDEASLLSMYRSIPPNRRKPVRDAIASIVEAVTGRSEEERTRGVERDWAAAEHP